MTKLELFFERIGLSADTQIEFTYEFIKKVQYHAVCSVAYENLDLLEKKPLSLDLDAIFEKIVVQKRGGYCFEVNALLSWFFKEAGFCVQDYFARFLRGQEGVPMRRHRVLSVLVDGDRYMCDIGIGQSAPRVPVKMEAGLLQEQFGEQYKFEMDTELGWVLYDLYQGAWRPFISFTEEKQYEIDFLYASFFCETHPDSIFNKTPILSIKTEDGRKTINNREYKIFKGEDVIYIEENITNERFYELVEKEFYIQYK